ncbi:MAG: DNA polymerase III subunit delta, partial [Propionibacteriaceae bacterium]|nr:DNA polymerase III subunit delta [Propionibacteriaceae bacterium]
TATQVERYFSGRAEVSAYAIADAVCGGNVRAALEQLRWALDTGVGGPAITGAIASNLRSLGKYFEAQAQGLTGNKLAEAAGVPPWKLKRLSPMARDWRAPAIAAAIQAVAKADTEVKGAAVDPDYALERLILRIAALRGRR